MAEWHTAESARDQWADAPTDDGDNPNASLEELLNAAQSAVLAYAPELDGTYIIDDGYIEQVMAGIPDAYRIAQLMQARNIWNAKKASPAGEFDNGSYGLSSFPLDWAIRQLLRPKRGRPVMA